MDLSNSWLTVADCAARLHTSTDQVLAEIKAGRLPARILQRPSGRRMYRIEPDDFAAYVAAHWQQSSTAAA